MNSVEGRIIKAISGFYYVETTDNTYECKARGAFRKNSNTPVVGDLVTISIPESGYPTVEEIHKRKNSIVRPPMANIDTFSSALIKNKLSLSFLLLIFRDV